MSDSETTQILKDEKLNQELLEFLNSNPTEEELHIICFKETPSFRVERN